jgi:hypothetical protein
MSGNHTPTPWPEFMDFEFQSDPIAILQPESASENGGFKIAIFYGPDRVANAALVIAAVNSYASSQAEIERLKKALEPFAKLGAEAAWLGKADDRQAWGFDGIDLTWGDFRRAVAALSGSKG